MARSGASLSFPVVDPFVLAVAVIAALALVGAVIFWVRSRRLRSAIDEALERIGDRPLRRRFSRSVALRTGIDRLEDATARSERHRAALAGAVSESSFGVIITDDNGVVTLSNGVASRFLGTRRGEAVTDVRIRDAIEQAVVERTPVSRELELHSPVRRVLLLSAIPLDHGVESAGVVAYITDLTEERRVEVMRRDFVANVGHELKTPLGALAVLAETMAGAIDDPAMTERLAGRVEDESRRLSSLVDDILDLSQAEALSGRSEPIDVGSVIADSVAVLADTAVERGVVLTVDPTPHGALVTGDRRQLQSMFIHLIENAIEYGDPRERVSSPVVAIRVLIDGENVMVDVEDQGIGIPESHLPRVFERFYRVDQTRSRETGGTGLGLSIVRNIAVAHGGTASVRSAVGVGSTFTVRLPRWSEHTS